MTGSSKKLRTPQSRRNHFTKGIAHDCRTRGWENNRTIDYHHARHFLLVLPVLVIVGALIAYKSSASLAVIGKVSETGVFTPRGNVIPAVGASEAGLVTRTLNYFLVIWPALLFGI